MSGALAFAELARAAARVASTLEPERRAGEIARLLGSIESEGDLMTAARWLAGDRRFTPHPTIASTLPVRLYAALSGEEIDEPATLDHEIFLACRAMAGGTLEAIRMLLVAKERIDAPVTRAEGLLVEQVVDALAELARTSGTEARLELLYALWSAMGPEEIVLLHRLLGRGTIVEGVGDEIMAHAIARAFAQPARQVRHALAIDGDAGATALAARRGALESTAARPMQLIEPMHAVALERVVDESGAIRLAGFDEEGIRDLMVEERLPGARAQLHVWPSDDEDDPPRVALLSASGRDLSPVVPELAATLAHVSAGAVIDGQLIVADAGGAVLDATTLERAASRGEVLEPAQPPAFVGFDLLVEDGLSLLDAPLEERRFRLEEVAAVAGLPITRAIAAADRDELERHYVETIARGGLGVVAKRRGSAYEFGRRSGAWIKAPGEPETILAVIRYAAAGELTFGIWLAEGNEEPRLVNIGRAACELDAGELERLDRRLRRLRTQRFGTTWEIAPRIVCELEYDAIRVSPRTDAGYTIRVACVRCIRWDLDVESAARVEEVERRHRTMAGARSLEEAIVRPTK